MKKTTTPFLVTALAMSFSLGLGGGCYTGTTPGGSSSGATSSQTSTSGSATDPANSGGVGTTLPPPASDLPCDVASVLSLQCVTCHADTPTGGAPNRLMTHDDLVQPSAIDPNKSNAELCLERMKDTRRPMPLSAPFASDAQLAIFESWIRGGMKSGTCSVATPYPIDFEVEAACTTNRTWSRGDRGSDEMRPGVACVECHKRVNRRDAGIYSIAGTIYATAHEPDNCYGVAATKKVTVVITDANEKTYKVPVNGAGNFYLEKPIATPYRAKLVRGDVEIRMLTPQTEGDCNTCHTPDGKEDTRGRIVFPL